MCLEQEKLKVLKVDTQFYILVALLECNVQLLHLFQNSSKESLSLGE